MHRLIHTVGKVGHRYGQHQLRDLLFGKVFPHVLQLLVADRRCRAGDKVGKMNDGFFFLVEELAALVERKRLDLFCGNSNPLRRSGMGPGSILAAIHNRGLEIGKLFILLLHGAGSGHGGVERQKGL